MTELPRKLKKDGIVEALLEVRFTSRELPELLVGRLASGPAWAAFAAKRLALADLPAPLRQADANMRYQPVLQLGSPDGLNAVKIGERVFSWHALSRYPGWENFEPQLSSVLEFLFKIQDFAATRLGLRYINLLNDKDHYIRGVEALNLSVAVDEKPLEPPLNVNYRRNRSPEHEVVVRVASPEFVKGPKDKFAALIDIDVSTVSGVKMPSLNDAKKWVDDAHEIEKREFFALLRNETVARLAE